MPDARMKIGTAIKVFMDGLETSRRLAGSDMVSAPG
jgi:hypothetical protein